MPTMIPAALSPTALNTKGRPSSASVKSTSSNVAAKASAKSSANKPGAKAGGKGKRSPNARSVSAVMFADNVNIVEPDNTDDTNNKPSRLEMMVVEAAAQAANRRAKLEAEATEWLEATAKSRAKTGQDQGVSHGGESIVTARGPHLMDRSPGAGQAVLSGVPYSSGEWSEAFSRKRAMNRMTEAVAAAAAEAAASISSSSTPGNSPLQANNLRAKSPPALSASMFGVRGSGFDSSPIRAAMAQHQQETIRRNSSTKSSMLSELIPIEGRQQSPNRGNNSTAEPSADVAVVTLNVPELESHAVAVNGSFGDCDSPRTPKGKLMHSGSKPPRPTSPSNITRSPSTPIRDEDPIMFESRLPSAAVGRPALSDIKSNVIQHVPVDVELVGCPEHDFAPFVAYCHSCQTPVCTMCLDLNHSVGSSPSQSSGGHGKQQRSSPQTSGHDTEPLADFINGLVSNVKAVKDRNEAIAQQLSSLEASHPSLLQGLHGYINEEMDGLLRTLEEKREGLHGEVNSMRGSLLHMLSEELATCERGLGQLTEGRHVLELMMEGEGTSHTHMGDLVHGSLPYDAFLLEADPILTAPPRVTEQLLLQLPIQSLQDVCDLVSWTEVSMNSQPQIFPK
eukprot:GILI01021586.1.p1 GENE.GILI01021586.1~~GILI01021586.1.p1  ORF type:complete len:621 (-),score=143.56 GILI01021586.1:102-1964(-)